MKRSQVNAAIRSAIELAGTHGFALPPFARWTPDEWQNRGAEYDGIRRARLGWDVTDFGAGAFDRLGLTLLTIRNGRPDDPASKPYCEKLLFVQPGQLTPLHFHWKKTEDIINRGGGDLVCEVYNSTPEDRLDRTAVVISCDGRGVELAAGGRVVLKPGESITLTPRVYHSFWADSSGPPVLVGEVSSVNDDQHDNRFLDPLGRFSAIEEDEPPIRWLCHEYPPAGA